MKRAHEVMVRTVATCSSDTPLADAAKMMRDLNIGTVMVVDNGKLHGILTDRDLAVRALPDEIDPRETSVKRYMSTNLVTGEMDWQLDRVAKEMAKHQVRRLPITKDGMLVGIVSLGDVALHLNQKEVVAESLKHISDSTRKRIQRAASPARWAALIAPVAASLAVVWLVSMTKTGERIRKQIAKTEIPDRFYDAVTMTSDKLRDPKTRRAVAHLSEQMRENLDDVVSMASERLNDPRTRKAIDELNKQMRDTFNDWKPQFKQATRKTQRHLKFL